MQQVNVKFNDVNQIRKFVDVIDKIDSCFNLGEGRRVVDAKSRSEERRVGKECM